MKRYIKIAILIIVVVFLAACGCGRNIKRPQPDSLTLGHTTFAEILQRFGKPSFSGNKPNHIGYLYDNFFEQAAFKLVTPVRSLIFYFSDDILVGYYFDSSFMNDSTYFEPEKVKQIKKGITTRDQVINLFGTSYGEFVFPKFLPNRKKLEKDLNDKEGKGIWYVYNQTKSRGSGYIYHYHQELVVIFNKEDVVSNIYFESKGRF